MGSIRNPCNPLSLITSPLPYDLTKFDIFVNESDSFQNNFEPLKTPWNGTVSDITKVSDEKDDPYFASLLAAYIISHKSGISMKHLTGDNKLVTSIARYYVYYHMKRFTGGPRKMEPFITDDMKDLVRTNLQNKSYMG